MASKSRFSEFLRALWCGGHFWSPAEAFRAKAASSASPCPSGRNGLPARLAGSEKLGQGPSGKGPLHASSNAVGWPEMAHHVGGPQDEAPNRDFLGFCVFGGAEGISRAWKKRFVRKRPPPAKQTLSEADRPENLRCRSGSPVDKG